jgi:hypothetical protein
VPAPGMTARDSGAATVCNCGVFDPIDPVSDRSGYDPSVRPDRVANRAVVVHTNG